MKFKQTNGKFDEQQIKLNSNGIDQFDSYEIRIGVICPKCRKGTFDYDGMLNLVCSSCGYTSGGCFT